jgi:Dolichyl-phosphate-mannose-protein mannosyltransferase
MSMKEEHLNTGPRSAVGVQGAERYRSPARARGDVVALGMIALAVAIIHVATNGRFGFHRDELQVLDDARHMDWGFVAYPPFTPLVERIGLALFSTSLVGLRLFSVIAQAFALILTGLIAREFGARRLAQVVAALCVAVSPLPMFEATEFQYTSFDLLWWVLIAYFLVRLLNTEDPRWWLGIGAAVGVGFMTKYSMAFYVAGLAGAILLTPTRRYLKSRWLWYGAAWALLIFLPNLVWQIRHDFVSFHFLHYIHARDVGEGRANDFIRDQFMINMSPFLAPLWLAGLYFLAFRGGKHYRLLAWLYVIPVAIFYFAKGRGYYAGALYPMLFAAGVVVCQQWIEWLRPFWSCLVQGLTFAALAVSAAAVGAFVLPLGQVSATNFALRKNGDLREEVGWRDLVGAVAKVRDALSLEERANFAIITGNYGETGALDLYGPAYGLPQVISGTNTAWYRGYGNPPPENVIAVGISRKYLERHFSSCTLAGHNGNPYGINNEESREHPDIFVCAAPLNGWAEFWKDFQWFG